MYGWTTDKDGIQDGGELGFENVTVNLYESDDTPAGSTTTNSSGIYSFSIICTWRLLFRIYIAKRLSVQSTGPRWR